MGDLVAVFQAGGVLAQFGTPAEILSNPATEFVARFVGDDRGLKRLALNRVSDLDLMQVALGRPGDDAAAARDRAHADPFRYLLMVDEAHRPLGWVDEADIPTSGTLDVNLANPVSPIVNKRTTLKDALSMMLDADVQAAIVVDRTGAVQGIMTVERVARLMREGEHGRMYGVFGDED
jgi:osmoprotectant transport system ATP-binding protein